MPARFMNPFHEPMNPLRAEVEPFGDRIASSAELFTFTTTRSDREYFLCTGQRVMVRGWGTAGTHSVFRNFVRILHNHPRIF